jgi:hypothetical protein
LGGGVATAFFFAQIDSKEPEWAPLSCHEPAHKAAKRAFLHREPTVHALFINL